MSTHCYVGATDPDNPHLVHARFVLSAGHPSVVLPTLAAIWAGHARQDTRALITAILATDWEHLDPDITATSGFAGQHPVPGVGMTLAATTDSIADAPEPVTVFPLCHAGHLDVEWIYLVDPGTDTIAVHTDDGSRIARYPLTGCLPPPATMGRCLAQRDSQQPAAGASR
ncbi:hypothetical protein [Micromonospora sp. 4G55]|uniref:hypothetical protein n=1 Tax=Micromonospora sp. 4G55 TaxID=2806102 RepID=UPI001A530185|nr:hypothetical protein [Micromonospora sp. 4G55]MBM0255854.1 hypothetical protein [Micromonospora sp. 4G55]